jgi:hypothetical protein
MYNYIHLPRLVIDNTYKFEPVGEDFSCPSPGGIRAVLADPFHENNPLNPFSVPPTKYSVISRQEFLQLAQIYTATKLRNKGQAARKERASVVFIPLSELPTKRRRVNKIIKRSTPTATSDEKPTSTENKTPAKAKTSTKDDKVLPPKTPVKYIGKSAKAKALLKDLNKKTKPRTVRATPDIYKKPHLGLSYCEYPVVTPWLRCEK